MRSLFEDFLSLFKLCVRGALIFVNVPLGLQVDLQQQGAFVDGLHGLDAMPVVIVIRLRKQNVGVLEHRNLAPFRAFIESGMDRECDQSHQQRAHESLCAAIRHRNVLQPRD